LSFNLNYTYSKNLDLMSSPDIFNRAMGKDISGNVSTISGLVKGNGATRAISGITNYVDNQIVTNVPPQSFVPGESLVAVLEFEVIATNAANTLVVVCNTNAATSGDELIIEIDSGTP
jgi:hypothetical protein